MGRYFRTVQEIKRTDPDYKYVVEIKSAPGLLGGYNVTVQGFALNTEHKDDNENYLDDWFWQRPERAKLFELVDRLHLSVRGSMNERDWEKEKENEMQKHLEAMREQMQREFASQLERRLKDEAAKIRRKAEAGEFKP